MNKVQELLAKCEDFFEQISNEEKNEELGHAMVSTRTMLERAVDGWTYAPELEIVEDAQSQIKEIWQMVSRREKTQNNFLEDYYEEVLSFVTQLTDELENRYDCASIDDFDCDSSYDQDEEDDQC